MLKYLPERQLAVQKLTEKLQEFSTHQYKQWEEQGKQFTDWQLEQSPQLVQWQLKMWELQGEELKDWQLEKIQKWTASKALSDNSLLTSRLKSKFIKNIDDCVKPIVVQKLLSLKNGDIPDSYIPYIIDQVREFLYGISNELLPNKVSFTEVKNELTALHSFLINPIQQCYEHTYNTVLEILYYVTKLLGDEKLNTVHTKLFLSSRVEESNKEYYEITDQEFIKLKEVAKYWVPVYKKYAFTLVDSIIEVVEKFISNMQNDKDALIKAVDEIPLMENGNILYNGKVPITIKLKKLFDIKEIVCSLPETLKGGLVTAGQLNRIGDLTANLQELTEELSPKIKEHKELHLETKEHNDHSYNQLEKVAEAVILIGEETWGGAEG
ncbi:hypothetical protein [Candidatus Tisiphia endosymbiont of Nemotelus uliginosus]|uniref:hypothetical protein n=1 Tax=Candidatus Tisiphia endosymbiont of Nemotelus uliginosus TaxID=3077926 RepID=UPI0035C8DA02